MARKKGSKQVEGRMVECEHRDCKYRWKTKAKKGKKFVTCPGCLRKTRIKEVKK